jgi:hypothetical protein
MDAVLNGILARVLSQEHTWTAFQAECAAYHARTASTLAQLRARDDKKQHGDLWELFCLRYLLVEKGARAAWLLKDVPAAVRAELSLGAADMGIDIVAVAPAGGAYWAVQCKWRAPDAKTRTYISWAQLSTFYALTARTGPYQKHLVLTNAAGARHVGARQPQDETVAAAGFNRMPRDAWARMLPSVAVATPAASTSTINTQQHDIQFIREARIKALSGVIIL